MITTSDDQHRYSPQATNSSKDNSDDQLRRSPLVANSNDHLERPTPTTNSVVHIQQLTLTTNSVDHILKGKKKQLPTCFKFQF